MQNGQQLEKAFLMNVSRLCGKVEAITIDNVLELIQYASFHGITDILFIEEAYLGHLFSNQEFLDNAGIHVCSLLYLAARYEEAKKK